MNKRSASIIAGGLVFAFLAGVVALAVTFSGGGGAATAKPEHRKPIVRTVHRTKTIHRKAKSGGGTVVLSAPQSQPQSQSVAGSPEPETDPSPEQTDDVNGSPEGSDDGYEGDDEHEDDREELGAPTATVSPSPTETPATDD